MTEKRKKAKNDEKRPKPKRQAKQDYRRPELSKFGLVEEFTGSIPS